MYRLTVLAFRPFVSNGQCFSFSFLVPLIDSSIRFLLRSGVGHDDESAGWTLVGAVRNKHLQS
jgi:hypothetical protein